MRVPYFTGTQVVSDGIVPSSSFEIFYVEMFMLTIHESVSISFKVVLKILFLLFVSLCSNVWKQTVRIARIIIV